MRPRSLVPLLLGVALGLTVGVTSAVGAATTPPPPPPPPTLVPPPAPPTPVPTVAPTELAPQPVVDVRLATTKVSRGKTEKINIAASTDDVVVVTIRYRSGKPLVIKAKVGSSGTLVKTWTVPKSAPVGKASVKVVVESDGTQISKSFTFQVT